MLSLPLCFLASPAATGVLCLLVRTGSRRPRPCRLAVVTVAYFRREADFAVGRGPWSIRESNPMYSMPISPRYHAAICQLGQQNLPLASDLRKIPASWDVNVRASCEYPAVKKLKQRFFGGPITPSFATLAYLGFLKLQVIYMEIPFV
ncbi:hypothetical protein DFH06DRAFT_390869 [Mycena polygramma]|nr:hypothetical protein DFH06DRAFT_390869 [Mycena polygramma]